MAQDTLIAVATGIGGFRGNARFTTWLYQIVRNRVVDHVRRTCATVPLEGHDVGDAQRVSSLIAGQHRVRQLLRRLPSPYREAVVLRDVERLVYAEAAQQLGRNVNTVKSPGRQRAGAAGRDA